MTPPTTHAQDAPGVPGGDGSSEEWWQRERYRELLEELRTIIPGVQVLFAFLLTVPFSGRFGQLDALGRQAFTVSLVAAALAAVVFLTPAAYHRVSDRHARARRRRGRRREPHVVGAAEGGPPKRRRDAPMTPTGRR